MKIMRIGLDLAKNVFEVFAVDSKDKKNVSSVDYVSHSLFAVLVQDERPCHGE